MCAPAQPVTPRIFVPALMFVFVNRRRQGFVWSDFCICYTVGIIFGHWKAAAVWSGETTEVLKTDLIALLWHNHWEREGQFSHTLNIRPDHRIFENAKFLLEIFALFILQPSRIKPCYHRTVLKRSKLTQSRSSWLCGRSWNFFLSFLKLRLKSYCRN